MVPMFSRGAAAAAPRTEPDRSPIERNPSAIALLSAGRDKPYALGLVSALLSIGIPLDFIGSDLVDSPQLHGNPLIKFLKLRDQQLNAGAATKVLRILRYYVRLMSYAATAEPELFHLLWNNKIEWFDRTLLMLYYRLLGKKVLLTVHNVNAGKRDGTDSAWNRVTLRIQYKVCDHLFVHTEKMKQELTRDFNVAETNITVIPFGVNNTIPTTNLSSGAAKDVLNLRPEEKTILFFGNIAPYKGLTFLVRAFEQVAAMDRKYRLVIAGSPKWTDEYWREVECIIDGSRTRDRIVKRIEYVPDEETEIYFKAADVLVLPYTHVFQSGVLFLGYSFGLPAITADVGSLREEIIEGETGFVCNPCDAVSLAGAIERYFDSELYRKLEQRREFIKQYANERYSWSKVACLTSEIYARLLATFCLVNKQPKTAETPRVGSTKSR